MNSKNLTPGHQTERKKNKYETLRPSIFQIQIWDSKVQKSPKTRLLRPIKNASKILRLGQNQFSETHVFQGTILHPSNAKCSLHQILFISLLAPSNE